MKRMNLIHVALVAVLTFMGTISLSAQAWYQPPVAGVAIDNAISDLMDDVPAPAANPDGKMTTKNAVLAKHAQVGCAGCTERAVKLEFLKLTLQKLREGEETGQAVTEVRDLMISNNIGNNAGLNTLIQNTYLYMVDLLS